LTDWNVAWYRPEEHEEWDRVVAASGTGTFLHRRSFLAYHGDRFVDRSLVARDDNGHIQGVFPAAQSPVDANVVVSHPGATFGGLLATPDVTGGPYLAMMECALRSWARAGYKTLKYKPVPAIYHTIPREDDRYALWILDARVSQRALSACIDLEHRLPATARRNRSLGKARRANCSIEQGSAILPELWPVIEAALKERHNVRPVHTLEEMQYLALSFEPEIQCLGASLLGEFVGAVILFLSPQAAHVQYSLTSTAGMAVGAMDLLVEQAIEIARARRVRFFDFGISTDPSGTALNDGLHRFKTEFGAGAVVYEQYDIELGLYAADSLQKSGADLINIMRG